MLRYAAPVPSVLVEAAFIDNPPEEELLASEEGRAAEAAAIADAIVAHLADPGPANTAPSPAAPGGPPPDADGCTDPELDGTDISPLLTGGSIARDTLYGHFPRTKTLAGRAGEGMITWVTRSRLFGFPDYTTAAARPDGSATILTLSRKRLRARKIRSPLLRLTLNRAARPFRRLQRP